MTLIGADALATMAGGVFSVDVQMSLRNGDSLNLCIVQIAELDIEDAKQDRPRPKSIQTVRDLLGHSGLIRRYWTRKAPATILMPEYAFGSGDWDALDEIVRSAEGPVVLIAGFGGTLGAWFRRWVDGEGEGSTARILAVDNDDFPAQDARHAGGWCWIKRPDGSVTCITFLKNRAEPNIEHTIINGFGTSIARIEFKDAVVYPLLCADCLGDGKDAPLARIRDSVKGCSKPILVTASLWQDPPRHAKWRDAFNRLFNDLRDRKDTKQEDVVLALANHAIDKPVKDEDDDCWRSMSGIIIRPFHPQDRPDSDHAVRALPKTSDSYDAVLLRRSTACLTLGVLHWPPYSSGHTKQAWTGCKAFRIADIGTVDPSELADRQVHELDRFIRRHLRDLDPASAPKLEPGLGKLRSAVEELQAEALNTTILWGVDRQRPVCPDRLHDYHGLLPKGLFGLAHLLGHSTCEFQVDPQLTGQAVLTDKAARLLVWNANISRPTLRRRIQTWQHANRGHPSLIVVNSTIGDPLTGTIDPDSPLEGEVQVDARTDISNPNFQSAGERKITAAGFPRVLAYSLGAVQENYEEDDLDSLIDDLKAKLP